MQPLLVVAGVIVRDGRILVSQRPARSHQALLWEFPGGKVEEGETPEQALERELFEELGVKTRTGRIFDVSLCEYPEKQVLILFYWSEILDGDPRPLDANAICWARPDELKKLDFAKADTGVARRLESENSFDV